MNYTTGKFFLDTNVLIYLFGKQDNIKKEISRSILVQGRDKAVFVISTQVIQEFASIMLSKFKLDPKIIKDLINEFTRLEVVHVNASLIRSALDHHILYGYSFWDSLIISAALKSNCSVLLTEDMQHQQKISGMIIHNPFHLTN